MTCDDVRISLGGYALDTLEADETVEVEAHLEHCPACRAELAELSGLPPLLSRVSERDIQHAAAPPRAVLERLVAVSARRGRRSRVLLTLAASVAAVALAGTAWLAGAQSAQEPASTASVQSDTAGMAAPKVATAVPEARVLARPLDPTPGGTDSTPGTVSAETDPKSPPATPSAPPRPSAGPPTPSELRGSSGDVRLAVRLIAQQGSTLVVARISGVPAGTMCRLQVVDRDGTVTTVGSWSVEPGEQRGPKTVLEGSTPLEATDIQRVDLTTADGHPLASVTMPASSTAGD